MNVAGDQGEVGPLVTATRRPTSGADSTNCGMTDCGHPHHDGGGNHTLTAPHLLRGSLAGLACSLIVLVGALVVTLTALGVSIPACTLRSSTGIPCPVCGLTHVGKALLHGNVFEPFIRDPAGAAFLIVVAFTALGQIRSIFGDRMRRQWLRSPMLIVALSSTLALHWFTTLVFGGMLAPL